MAEFRMPSLGADMDEGTVVEWLVHPGDRVTRGQPVAVVDTAKAAIEVEVFSDGVVEEILVPVGTTVPVGAVLARLADAGAAPAAVPAPPPAATGTAGTPAVAVAAPEVVASAPPPAVRAQDSAPAPTPVPPTIASGPAPPAHQPPMSPVVRRLAHSLGVDLATVHGTGRGGAITRADVQSAAGPPAPPRGRRGISPYARRLAAELGVDVTGLAGSGPGGAVHAADVRAAARVAAVTPASPAPAPPAPTARSRPAAAEPAPATAGRASPGTPAARAAAMREAIGELMARSKREIPHYYLQSTVDLHACLERLRTENLERPVAERLVPAVALLKAAALAVREVPDLNGLFTDGAFHRSDHVHLGVAVALRTGGLVAPAIHDADALSLDQLMAALRDLVTRARAGRLRGSEMSDPTITVTNLGELGAELVHGVIYPPQVALVGFGAVLERPWAVEGMLAVRPVVTVTLAADHRVTDGRVGSRYLAAVASLLSAPEKL